MRGDRVRHGRGHWLDSLLLFAALTGIAILVVRVSVVQLLSRAPDAALRVWPGYPNAVFQQVTLRYAKSQRFPEDAWPKVVAAAQREPLAADPFVFAALRQPPGALERSTALLEESRRRNPRNRLARVLLLERYVRAARVPEIIDELATIDRLIPSASTVVIDTLATAAVDPRAADAVAKAVRDRATLSALLFKLVQKGAPSATILRLSANLPAGTHSTSTAWQSALLERLIDQGRYGEARRLWGKFSAVPASGPTMTVYNGQFERRPALPPFNWRLASGDVGAAELTSRQSLSVEYFGRRSGELAGQIMMLHPGRYRFRYQMEGRVDVDASKLGWYIRCAAVGQPVTRGRIVLAELLKSANSASRTVATNFDVPAGCNAQWLTLEGMSAEFPTSQSIEILSVSVTPLS